MFACSPRRQARCHATSDPHSRDRGTAPAPTRNQRRVQIGGTLARLADSGAPLGSLLERCGHERPALQFRNDRGGVDDPREAHGGGEIDLVTANGRGRGGQRHAGTAGEFGQGEAAEANLVSELGAEGESRGHARPRLGTSLMASRGHAVVAAPT